MTARYMTILFLSIFGFLWVLQPSLGGAAVPTGTASPDGGGAAIKNAATLAKPSMAGPAVGTAGPAVLSEAMKKSATLIPPKVSPPPPIGRVFKVGECPLTKGSDGVWRDPNGNATDEKIVHMGCEQNAQ